MLLLQRRFECVTQWLCRSYLYLCSVKCSVNLISSPNLVYSNSKIVTISNLSQSISIQQKVVYRFWVTLLTLAYTEQKNNLVYYMLHISEDLSPHGIKNRILLFSFLALGMQWDWVPCTAVSNAKIVPATGNRWLRSIGKVITGKGKRKCSDENLLQRPFARSQILHVLTCNWIWPP